MEDQNNISLSNEELGFNALQDIERQTDENIKLQRTSDRIVIKAKVILQPANASDYMIPKIQGVSGDISTGGCSAMFPVPVMVGDVYRLNFNKSQLDISMVFARCMRCRLISEDAYEVGFSFFNPIQLPKEVQPSMASSSLI